jgi:UDP-3-O-[3-hydroxymyristoyl] glucosamine N-acyltransferase
VFHALARKGSLSMMRLHQLAQLVGGNLTSAEDPEVTGAASIARANESQITFACTDKHHDLFIASNATAAVVPRSITSSSKPCICVDDVEAAFAKIAAHFKPPIERPKNGISPAATVSPISTIADDVCIHPGAVIMDGVQIGSGSEIFPNTTVMENVRIGENVKVYPNVTIYENTVIGNRSIIHAGAVLGAFGFGYKSGSGQHVLSAQLGNVVIGEDVEIGANTTIDRGTYDSTTIGDGSKLDNLVMVGHNCLIGNHNLLCSQVGIAGSCETGDYVVMGGQVGLADHLTIGDQVQIGAKSGLMHDAEPKQKLFGIPARPAREEMQLVASRAKLPEMRRTLKRIEKSVELLASQQAVNAPANQNASDEEDQTETKAA